MSSPPTRIGETGSARWEFATAGRILFGPGRVSEVAPAARQLGTRVLVVTGRSPRRASALLESLNPVATFSVEGEPTVADIRLGVQTAIEHSCDLIVGVGGGSAIDAGKAIAALTANAGDPLDYLEVIGNGQPLRLASAPYIAVPTTAGTGSEVTRNAVLGSPEHRVKASLRSPLMLPCLAVVDPELTLPLPPALTASTGMDALTQLIEPYVSVRANAMTDLYCLEGMRLAAGSLRRAFVAGTDLEARTAMAAASLFGGLALANAGLGAVHGFAAAIGGMFAAPHGAVCAALLPHVMETNLRAVRARAAGGESMARFATVGRILTGEPGAAPEDGLSWIRNLSREFAIPPLGSYGIATRHIPEVVESAARASSMKANPIPLSPEELRAVLEQAL